MLQVILGRMAMLSLPVVHYGREGIDTVHLVNAEGRCQASWFVRTKDKFPADRPIGLQKLGVTPIPSNNFQTVRSDGQDQIILGVNEP